MMKQLRYGLLTIFVCVFILIISNKALFASEGGDLLAEIDKLAISDDLSSKGFDESLVDRIESNPSVITTSLLPKLIDPQASEKQLAIYSWALGIAKDPKSVDPIIVLSKSTKSDWVRGNCYRALANINGQKAGEFLYSTLGKTEDKKKRYDLFDLLAQMHYEAALPKTEEILKLDPNQYYWQSIFIFGKMGDKAIPFLIKKIDDPDPNVRTNAINVLGPWLLAIEAIQPFREQFWKEKNANIRILVLNSLEMITHDPQAIQDFSKEVVTKEKESSLVKFAQETIDHNDIMKKYIDTLKKGKKLSPDDFNKQYDQLYKSAGKKGDYEILMNSSSLQDEPKLKKLREQILQRNSDECFYDYRKVNRIIMANRIIQVK